jgi:hypothetical protein
MIKKSIRKSIALQKYLEGVVLHLENGTMFKIHRHHLDLEWSVDKIPPLDEIVL